MSTKETRDMVYLQMVLAFIETSTVEKYRELQNTVEHMQTIDPRHAEMYVTIGKTLETLRDKMWTGVGEDREEE